MRAGDVDVQDLPALPDAEAALAELAARMAPAVAHDAAFVGIYSGGAWVAERLAQMLPGDHPVGFIDVAFYRDDYKRSGLKANTRRTELPFDVEGATIVLVDDVLFTGRSVRAAIRKPDVGATPHSTEATLKTVAPVTNTTRRP